MPLLLLRRRTAALAASVAASLLLGAAQATGGSACRSRYCPAVTGQARVSAMVAEGFDAEAAARGNHKVWPDALAPVGNWSVLADITKKRPKLKAEKFEGPLATYAGAFDTSASPANPVLDANSKWVLQGANMGPSVGACALSSLLGRGV